MSKVFPSLRSALPAAALACALLAGVHSSSAQSGATVQEPAAIGAERATSIKPYDFSGRVFDLAPNVGVGSGTLVHRHTVLTAGHVVYDPVSGFETDVTFSRGLYGSFTLSKAQVFTVQALSGYQSVADTEGNSTLDAFALDQGLLLLVQPSIDEDWANFTFDPTLLSNSAYATFVLGYPAETFDGRTLAYIVPGSPYVAAGAAGDTGLYENDDYAAEGGMSGGGIFVAIAIGDQRVAANTVGGSIDASVTFNASFVRAIDKTSRKFINDAEFTNGFIKRAKITGPKTVQRGTTVAYTVVPIFTTASLDPSQNGNTKVNTNRYDNLKLQSNVPAIQGAPRVTVVKVDNETFNVTFDAGLPANSTTVLQAYYDGTNVVSGKSSLTVTIK